MLALRDISIKTKLFLLMAFTALLALFLVVITLFVIEKTNARKSYAGQLTSIADVIALNSGTVMEFHDEEAAREILMSLAAKPEIIFAVLHDKEGKIFCSYTKPGVNEQEMMAEIYRMHSDRGTIRDELNGKENMIFVSKNHMHVVRPVRTKNQLFRDDDLVGSVHLVDNMQELYSRLHAYYAVVAGIVVITVLVVVVLAGRLQRLFTEPLQELMHSIDKVRREKNYEVRVAKKSNDEFGCLIDGFNEMIKDIYQRESELQKYSSGLEKMVEKRTREISRANEELAQLVNDLENAKKAAEQGSRAKSEFLATMSHEIRTPMNGILGMTELLRGSGLNNRQLRFIQTIQRAADSLVAIINDILDFSKIEAGKFELEIRVFNLRELLEDAVEMMAEWAHLKGLELILAIPEELPDVLEGDSIRLRQIIVNLLGNAVKFTEIGEVLLKVEEVCREEGAIGLRFSVQDTGIGVSEEIKEQIFHPFSQADSSRTRKYGGTGLGLSISRKLVNLMGGEIQVNSEPDKGTTFWFVLTFKLNLKQKETIERSTIKNLVGKRVLVVDDNVVNRTILKNQVLSWGMAGDTAENGSQALEKLRVAAETSRPYDVALIDWQMPEMNGIELARCIRRDFDKKKISLVMLSSAPFDEEATRANEAGVDLYLSKPVRQSLLYSSLASLGKKKDAKEDYNNMEQDNQVGTYRNDSRDVQVRVLLVEDNQVNQDVAREMLRYMNCRIEIAENGLKALDAFKEGEFDLILMDCHMPQMDGFTAAEEIRKLEEERGTTKRVPIIALTGDVQKGIKDLCHSSGMDDFLSKPFYINELQSMLVRWLGPRISAQTVVPDVSERVSEKNEGAASLLDQKRLDMIRAMQHDNSPSVLDKIIVMYNESSPELMRCIHDAVDKGNADSLREAAHNLKSSSANLGATDFAALCRELENMGSMGKVDESCSELLGQLDEAYKQVVEALSWEMEKNINE